MSPNTRIEWNDEMGLLCAYPGEAAHEEPCFVWDYSVFEEFNREAITPSMYEWMTGYVQDNLTKDDLWALASDDYDGAALTEEAVDAYYEVPIRQRIQMHTQTLENLEAEKQRMLDKVVALAAPSPFDPHSPVYVEYCQWAREETAKFKKMLERIEEEIHEEEQWRGGHEEGMEDES
jgi:hypothetical protein